MTDDVRKLAMAKEIYRIVFDSNALQWFGCGLKCVTSGDMEDAHWQFWMAGMAEKPKRKR